jgi:nucleoside-triphosphatase THEP1
MQQTFKINTGNLNSHFIESVKSMFGNRDVKIVIEDVGPASNQREQFRKTEKLRKKLMSIKVNPDTNLSDLANEVNL